MVEHFLQKGHKEDEFMCSVLHVGRGTGDNLQTDLLRNEAFWTQKLGTMTPAGLNLNLDFSSFL